MLIGSLAVVVAAVSSAGLTPSTPGASPEGALSVLHEWDGARAAAYAHADADALRALYVAGSTAADADVRLLARYTERGIRVSWLQTQVFSVRVVQRGHDRLRLALVDRVVGAVATPARCVALPVERPARRVVALRRVGHRWRVASTGRPGPGGVRADGQSASRSSASTSSWANR